MIRNYRIGSIDILNRPLPAARISASGQFLYVHKYKHKSSYEFKCMYFYYNFRIHFIDGTYNYYLIG